MKRSADYKAIVKLGLPILVGQVGTVVVGFADNIMVGRYSTDALAASSFVVNVFNMVMFCCMGFTYGVLPLAGSLFARNEKGKIGSLLRDAIAVNIAYALLLTSLMAVLYFNLHHLGQPEHLLPQIRPYYLLYLAGIVPIALFNVFAQWSYAVKDTMMPMWIILITNLMNIGGNYLLIYGNFGCPEMGLFGAGVSTLFARIVAMAAIIMIFAVKKANAPYRSGLSSSRLSKERLKRVWRTSLPVSMQMTFESASFSVAAVMAGWIGAIALASYQIIIIIGMLGFCLYYAIGSAIAVMVANETDNSGMRRVAWAGYHVMLVLASCSISIFIVFGRPLMSLFTEDQLVLATTMTLIFPLVLYQLGDATQITFANALRGTSNVMPMLWVAFVSYIIIGIPATYLLGFTASLGIFGIVLSFSVSLFCAGSLFLYFFLRTTRRRPLYVHDNL